jgi:hypothetical protein
MKPDPARQISPESTNVLRRISNDWKLAWAKNTEEFPVAVLS